MLKKYKTILKQGQAELTERKSRFIAISRPISSEDEAKRFLEEYKKKYWDASHHVYAYQIGEKDELKRFSDDGEPQGTAGMPVLDVLARDQIKNTMILVVRYFGGTLLGTGGLVRAYGKAAKNALIDAGIAEIVLYQSFSIISDYSLSGKIEYNLLQNNFILHDTSYLDQVTFLILAELDRCIELESMITEITAGKAIITKGPEKYGAWIDTELKIFE